jgi:hypothetical protein
LALGGVAKVGGPVIGVGVKLIFFSAPTEANLLSVKSLSAQVVICSALPALRRLGGAGGKTLK